MTMTPPKLLSIKLKTGEVIFAEELNEDDISIEILNPLQIMLVPERQADGSFQEFLSSKPWHPFTSDKYYLIYKSDIIHYGQLKEYYRTYYLKTLVTMSAEDAREDISESEEYETETECVEEFEKRLNLLAERLGIIDPDEEPDPDEEISTLMISESQDLVVFDTHKTLQ
jgi:hypothetical protein